MNTRRNTDAEEQAKRTLGPEHPETFATASVLGQVLSRWQQGKARPRGSKAAQAQPRHDAARPGRRLPKHTDHGSIPARAAARRSMLRPDVDTHRYHVQQHPII